MPMQIYATKCAAQVSTLACSIMIIMIEMMIYMMIIMIMMRVIIMMIMFLFLTVLAEHRSEFLQSPLSTHTCLHPDMT